MMKYMLTTFLVLIIILSQLSSISYASELSSSYEGTGFDSPEAAVEAYIDAFNSGDVSAMLSTFAIETAIDHLNPEYQAERTKQFNQNNNSAWNTVWFPVFDTYTRNLAIGKRMSELADTLGYQFWTYAWPSEDGEYWAGMEKQIPVDRNDFEANVNKFYMNIESSDVLHWFGRVVIKGYMSPDSLDISEAYYHERNQENLEKVRKTYGCEELVELVARLDIVGEEYLQFMQCARFGDKWYNYSTVNCNMANLMGISSYSGGLVRLNDLR